MLNLTINGRAVTVEKGKTVLDACRAAEAYVPTLCDDPALEPYGACRLCIVSRLCGCSWRTGGALCSALGRKS